MEKLEVRHVSLAFDGKPVLRDVSLTLREGELVCLLAVLAVYNAPYQD